jgi:hypothetical protein
MKRFKILLLSFFLLSIGASASIDSSPTLDNKIDFYDPGDVQTVKADNLIILDAVTYDFRFSDNSETFHLFSDNLKQDFDCRLNRHIDINQVIRNSKKYLLFRTNSIDYLTFQRRSTKKLNLI